MANVLVVRGEAKSQQPHLVVHTWRDHLRRPHVLDLSGHALGLAYFLGMSEK